jgi:hypothetical protein
LVAFTAAASIIAGAAVLRSPKDAANQTPRIKPAPKIVPMPFAPAAKLKSVAPRSPQRSFHITLMCDPATNGAGYHWYRGSNSLPNFAPSSGIYTINNWVIESNLWPEAYYDFCVAIVGSNGVESNLSTLVHWPPTLTNYPALGVSALPNSLWTTNTIRTNPPTGFYRLHLQAGIYALHSSPNFHAWTPLTNWANVIPMPTFYLRASKWDNVTGMAQPD